MRAVATVSFEIPGRVEDLDALSATRLFRERAMGFDWDAADTYNLSVTVAIYRTAVALGLNNRQIWDRLGPYLQAADLCEWALCEPRVMSERAGRNSFRITLTDVGQSLLP